MLELDTGSRHCKHAYSRDLKRENDHARPRAEANPLFGLVEKTGQEGDQASKTADRKGAKDMLTARTDTVFFTRQFTFLRMGQLFKKDKEWGSMSN